LVIYDKRQVSAKLKKNICNLCLSSRFKKVYKKFGLSLVKCRNCGLVYAYPRIPEDEILKRYSKDYLFNEYLTIFQADQRNYNMELVRAQYALYLQLLDSLYGEKNRILDIGCGPGFFLKAAEERGWKGEGVEVSKAAVQYAEEVVHVKVHHGQLQDIPLSPGSFDAVVLLDAIEHLFDPLGTIKDCYHLLSKDGVLILNTPDYNSLSRFILGKDWAVLSPAEHLYNFTQSTLYQMLRKAKFNSVKIHNLLQFNPDCTHNQNSCRYKLFEMINESLKRLSFFQVLQKQSHKRILKMFEGEDHSWGYKMLELFLRGDTLIAVANKD